jgi:hypothetical protein
VSNKKIVTHSKHRYLTRDSNGAAKPCVYTKISTEVPIQERNV